jgi:DNA-binding transcriptional LysR family regulator
MEWDDLRHVLALSRTGSLSTAGAALGTSHTTVGRRVRALEERLGVRLFDRTPDGFTATAAGADIASVAERMEEGVLALEARVLGRDVRLAGKLRVATMDMLFRHYHPVLSAFTDRYPSVELTVTASDVEVSLTRREADVALRLTNTPPAPLIGRKVGRIDFAVYASRKLVKRVGAKAPLGAYPWLHWDERLGMRWLDDWLAAHAPGARIAMRFDVGSVLLREAIAAGIGVHFLATFEGDGDHSLRRISSIEKGFSRDLWLLTLAELRHVPRVRAFLDHVADHLRDGGPERRQSARRRRSAMTPR